MQQDRTQNGSNSTNQFSPRWSAERLVSLIGGIASIIGLALVFLPANATANFESLLKYLLTAGLGALIAGHLMRVYEQKRFLTDRIQELERIDLEKCEEHRSDLSALRDELERRESNRILDIAKIHEGSILKHVDAITNLRDALNCTKDELAKVSAEQEELRQKVEDEKMSRHKHRTKHLENYHMLVHKIRDISMLWTTRPESREVGGPQLLFLHLAQSILDDVRELFLAYYSSLGIPIDQDVAVTLKLKVRKQDVERYGLAIESASVDELFGCDDVMLITLARDSFTKRNSPGREIGRRLYSLQANTAFDHIFRTGREKGAFFCDDLQALNKTAYFNENAKFMNYYNSTIATAIRLPGGDSDKARLFGFLCVDSLNTNNFPLYSNPDAFHIASHSADLLALLLFGTQLYEAVRPEKSHKPCSNQNTVRKGKSNKEANQLA